MALTSPEQEITKLKTQVAALEKRVDSLARLNEIFVKHLKNAVVPVAPGVSPKPLDAPKRLSEVVHDIQLSGLNSRRF